MNETPRNGSPQGDGEPRSAEGTPAPIDFTYRYRPDNPRPFFVPDNWQSASVFLEAGNALIVRFYNACRRGHLNPDAPPAVVEISQQEAAGEPLGEDGLPIQMPFAVVLGCSDARVPTELLFGQEFNDIFNIRVAGNIMAEEGIGSLLYALRSFGPEPTVAQGRSLKLCVVLGHRGCGAVRATVKTFQSGSMAAKVFGDPIGAIVSKIAAPALAVAAELLDETLGAGFSNDPRHIDELVELVVFLNAAWNAHVMQDWVRGEGPEMAARVGVVYGVFDPITWRVQVLPETPAEPVFDAFAPPPRDLQDLRDLGREVIRRITWRQALV